MEETPKRPLSRAERMFGKRESWYKAEDAETDDGPVPAKGFMLLKCPSCGRKKSFFLKNYQTSEICHECGAAYDIDKRMLRPVYAKCPDCGNMIRWLTNFDGQMVEVNCKTCGAPIDCELNAKGTAYNAIVEVRE